MAKGAATEGHLGKLHSKLADVFIKVLTRYEGRLDVIERYQAGDLEVTDQIEQEMLDELFSEGAMPNPAMLSAISKFLKDNEITFDTEQVDQLSSLERRLSERRQNRQNVVKLMTLDRVQDG